MNTISSQVSDKYQVVIPKEVRQILNIQPKDTLLFLIDGNTVLIRPKPASFTEALRGLHSHVWSSLGQSTEEWFEQERSSWE